MSSRLFLRNTAYLCAAALIALAAACSDPGTGSGNNANNGDDTGTVDTSTNDTGAQDTGTTDTGGGGDADTGGGDDADSGSSCNAENCQAQGENSIAECVSGTCEYRCEAGWVDANEDYIDVGTPEDSSDGCELECTPSNGGVEICDGEDNDCNGIVDDGFAKGSCTVGEGACEASGELVCNSAGDDTECDATAGTPGDETCGDSIDNDCDGETDESDAVDADTWYEDSDGDGYGDPNSSTTACGQPSGYVDNDTDCDDSDGNAYQELTGYTDSDGDGYGTGSQQTVCSGDSLPSGYADNDTDCNDSDGAVYQELDGYTDSDGDGYGVGSLQPVCSGASLPSGYADTDGDCDDNNGAVYTEVTAYTDVDGDSYTVGNSQTLCTDGSVPSGYASSQSTITDCDDSNASVYETLTVYTDADGDTYTVGSAQTQCTNGSPPSGFAGSQSTITDCDDSDAAVYEDLTVYTDADGDTYTVGSAQTQCTDGTVPSGFAGSQSTITDCDDSDAAIYEDLTVYTDSDGDTYTVGSAQTQCTDGTVPSGFAGSQSTITDCDDSDAAVYEELMVFQDTDGDTYTVGAAQPQCTDGSVPSGFTSTQSNTDDCDDNDDTVYPGAPGLCDNKDNDCNGQVDDIQVISGASHTYTPNTASGVPDGYLDDDDPALTNMLSTPTSDGFCTIQYDSGDGDITFSAINTSTGAFDTDTRALAETRDRRLLDVAWNGTHCAGLYHLDDNSLYITSWERSSGTIITKLVVGSSEGPPAFTTTKRWASLDNACLGSTTSSCTDQWLIAYHRNDGADTDWETYVDSLPGDYTGSSSFGGESLLDNDAGTQFDDIEVGPSPTGRAAVVYHDRQVGEWQVATTTTDAAGLFDNSTYDLTASPESFVLPVLGEAGGTVYLVRSEPGSTDLEIRNATSSGWGAGTSTNSESQESYLSKDIIAAGPEYGGWVLDSYGLTDDLNPFRYSLTGLEIPPGENIDVEDISSIRQEQFTAIRNAGPDILESITAYSGNPFRYKTTRYTCY